MSSGVASIFHKMQVDTVEGRGNRGSEVDDLHSD